MIVRCELPTSDLPNEALARDMMDYAVNQIDYENAVWFGHWVNPNTNDGGAAYLVYHKWGKVPFVLLWLDETQSWYSVPRAETSLPLEEYDMNPIWVKPDVLGLFAMYGVAGSARRRLGV